MIDRLRVATAKAHRRGAWAFGAVLVAGAMAAGTGWYYGGGPGSTSALPSVRGMTEDRASARLTAEGFQLGTSKAVWSAADAGVVTTTDPRPGTALPPGSTVSLVLSRGAQPATVPAVKGNTVAEATAAVAAARLTLGPEVDKASTREAGTVLRLVDADGDTVPAKTELPAGTALRLVVSTGPADAADPAVTPTSTP